MPWAADEPIGIVQRRAMLEQWEAEWHAGGDVVMGIFCREAAVGGCGLHRRIGPGGLEIGYWVHPQHLHQGVATQATRLLVTAAFSVPDVTHVEIHNDKGNTASAGVPQKLGFILIDERPDAPRAPAEIGIEQRWRMHRDQWEPRSVSPRLWQPERP
jgi:ribosomal-protein-serine acetyltransferase